MLDTTLFYQILRMMTTFDMQHSSNLKKWNKFCEMMENK